MDMTYSDTIQEAVTVIEGDKNTALMSTGVKLRFKDVPPFLIQTILGKFKEPEVPTYFDQDSNRQRENKNDPAYQKALEQFNADMSKATLDTILAFGTDIVSIPVDLEHPDSDDWIEVLDEIGVKVKRNSARARQLMWLRTFAVKTAEDIEKIVNHYGESTGTGEKAVAEAMETSFPSNS